MPRLQVLIPPKYDKKLKGPLIFLEGPIRCAPDWQAAAIRFFRSVAKLHAAEFKKRFSKGLTIASPRRKLEIRGDFTDEKFNQQVDWEIFHRDYAVKHGVILVWLPRPIKEIRGRAYAQTSRFEIGEDMARHRLEGARMVVGIEPGFSGGRYIRSVFALKAPTVDIVAHPEVAALVAWNMLARK